MIDFICVIYLKISMEAYLLSGGYWSDDLGGVKRTLPNVNVNRSGNENQNPIGDIHMVTQQSPAESEGNEFNNHQNVSPESSTEYEQPTRTNESVNSFQNPLNEPKESDPYQQISPQTAIGEENESDNENNAPSEYYNSSPNVFNVQKPTNVLNAPTEEYNNSSPNAFNDQKPTNMLNAPTEEYNNSSPNAFNDQKPKNVLNAPTEEYYNSSPNTFNVQTAQNALSEPIVTDQDAETFADELRQYFMFLRGKIQELENEIRLINTHIGKLDYNITQTRGNTVN